MAKRIIVRRPWQPKTGAAPQRLRSRDLYVRNLPYTINGDDLKRLFSKIAPVFSADVRDPGWGLVRMATEEGAAAAIEKLNGRLWNGRETRVEYKFERQPVWTPKNHEGRRFVTSGSRASQYSSKAPRNDQGR